MTPQYRESLVQNARLLDQVDTQRQVIEAQSAELDRLRRIISEQDQNLTLHRYSAQQRLLMLAAEHGRQRIERGEFPYEME